MQRSQWWSYMWDRCSVDVDTINARELEGFQPLQLLRIRTPTPTTNSSKCRRVRSWLVLPQLMSGAKPTTNPIKYES
ncbi:hypothetical protein DVH24_020066 [Malus domestica]|uniref:Uncharacterized protein n=1 Tax=Malus domestica TaxID=3750 RepID=A0A498JB49_MALDO|nr:hypothetical protein DVH24_020066 [Malus domestica]